MSSKLLEDDELLIEDRDLLTESQSNESRNTDEGPGPGCALHNYRNLPQEEEDLEYYATLKEKEEDWFAESQTYFQKLKWYVRPSKKVIYLILSIHTLSFTILMGPLMMLMLDNICTSHMKKVFPKPTCHHGGHMNMAANHTKRMDMVLHTNANTKMHKKYYLMFKVHYLLFLEFWDSHYLGNLANLVIVLVEFLFSKFLLLLTCFTLLGY